MQIGKNQNKMLQHLPQQQLFIYVLQQTPRHRKIIK